jgi:hypothetical protein
MVCGGWTSWSASAAVKKQQHVIMKNDEMQKK